MIDGFDRVDIRKVKREFENVIYGSSKVGEEIPFYFLGSDIGKYSYYLLSKKEISENKDQDFDSYADYVHREFGNDIEVDKKCASDMLVAFF